MADIVAQIIIDGSDVFSTSEQEVEELKQQGIVSYIFTNWEPTSYIVSAQTKSTIALEWTKFTMNIQIYLLGIELTQCFFFSVIEWCFRDVFLCDGGPVVFCWWIRCCFFCVSIVLV